MMMVNTSETCATRRLLQCREMGVYQIDVSRKFERHWSQDVVPDLSKEDFLARKKILEDVAQWYDGKGRMEELVPILYRYEVKITHPLYPIY
jgi:hypothetical protein